MRGERWVCPSPAPREREGPTPKGWEGEGAPSGETLTRLGLRPRHPLPHCGRGFLRRVQLEVFDGVVGPDLALFVFRHVGVDLVDQWPRIGPFVLDVREVGGKHD